MKTNKIWVCGVVLALAGLAREGRAAGISFSVIPPASTTGAAGTKVGFGYTITNSTTNFYQVTNINMDVFSKSTPNIIFDFPEVLPNTTVTELFTQIASANCPTPDCGLFEVILGGAPGTSDSGWVTISGEFYKDFNETVDLGAAVDLKSAYSVGVAQIPSLAPEPSSLALLGGGLLVYVARRKVAQLCRPNAQ